MACKSFSVLAWPVYKALYWSLDSKWLTGENNMYSMCTFFNFFMIICFTVLIMLNHPSLPTLQHPILLSCPWTKITLELVDSSCHFCALNWHDHCTVCTVLQAPSQLVLVEVLHFGICLHSVSEPCPSIGLQSIVNPTWQSINMKNGTSMFTQKK